MYVSGNFKKLEAAGKSKVNVNLTVWSKSIGNHMYWCSVTSPEEAEDRQEVVKQKWLSILNHVSDIHEGPGDKFPKCDRGELAPRTWIKKGTAKTVVTIASTVCGHVKFWNPLR